MPTGMEPGEDGLTGHEEVDQVPVEVVPVRRRRLLQQKLQQLKKADLCSGCL